MRLKHTMNRADACRAIREEWGDRNLDETNSCPALTMLYVPIQPWETPYDESTALRRGTIFPSLDKPFIGEGSFRHE